MLLIIILVPFLIKTCYDQTKLLNWQPVEGCVLDAALQTLVNSEQKISAFTLFLARRYQGVREFMSGIHPKKKPMIGFSPVSHQAFNKKGASDHIVIENIFGRLGCLRTGMCSKWR